MNNKLLYATFCFAIALSLVGCEEHMNISSTTSAYHDNTSQTNSSTQNSNLETNVSITELEEHSSNYNREPISIHASGKDSVVVVNGRAYLEGKELDIDTPNNVQLSDNNGKVLINGKPVKFKSQTSSSETINIKLTGKLVKVPLINITSLNSSFPVVQNCSNDSTQYLMIDSALQPYLQSQASNGFIHLKNNKYHIEGNLEVILYTQPLVSLDNQGSSEISLTCTDNKTFKINNDSISHVNISNLNSAFVSINQSGSSEIDIQGKSIKTLSVSNSGTGSVSINLPVVEGHIKNSGVGNITAQTITNLDVTNEGVGNIEIKSAQNIIQSSNSGVGNIQIND